MESNSSTAPSVAASSWYHTIELPAGVVTDGVFDTLGERPFHGRFQDAAAQRLGVLHSRVLARPAS